jgi:hypothetical protein
LEFFLLFCFFPDFIFTARMRGYTLRVAQNGPPREGRARATWSGWHYNARKTRLERARDEEVPV